MDSSARAENLADDDPGSPGRGMVLWPSWEKEKKASGVPDMRKLLIIAICLSVAGLSGVSLGAMYRPFFVWSSLEVTDQNDQTLFGNNPLNNGN